MKEDLIKECCEVREVVNKDGKRCSSYDEDCHKMDFLSVILCYTDAFNIFKGGKADGYCPIL